VSKVQSALKLAMAGLKVFPVTPTSKVPLKGWTSWEERATDDTSEIIRIWNEDSLANIGVATGPSNVVVLDFDSAKTPDEISGIEAFRAAYPDRKLPATYTVHTGSGGWHLYYAAGDTELRNSAGLLAKKVDTRANGGYVLGPGSVVSSREYTATSDFRLAALPEWIAERLTATPAPVRGEVTIRGSASAYATAALNAECKVVSETGSGGRNHAVNRAAWNLSRFVAKDELDWDEVEARLVHAALCAGLPSLEAQNAVRSGMTSGMGHYGE
jgi:hypothetical protein